MARSLMNLEGTGHDFEITYKYFLEGTDANMSG
jgi:hypothetical protein